VASVAAGAESGSADPSSAVRLPSTAAATAATQSVVVAAGATESPSGAADLVAAVRSGDPVDPSLSICPLTVSVRVSSATDGAGASGPPPRWSRSDAEPGSRTERTARITLPAEGRPYDRRDFVDRVEETVGIRDIEAFGPLNQDNVWNITFSTVAARQRFVAAGNFFIRSCRAVIAGAPQNRFVLRLHWVPYSVPWPSSPPSSGRLQVSR
jgi:hypothetical protein